jgi:hypothetical protein
MLADYLYKRHQACNIERLAVVKATCCIQQVVLLTMYMAAAGDVLRVAQPWFMVRFEFLFVLCTLNVLSNLIYLMCKAFG